MCHDGGCLCPVYRQVSAFVCSLCRLSLLLLLLHHHCQLFMYVRTRILCGQQRKNNMPPTRRHRIQFQSSSRRHVWPQPPSTTIHQSIHLKSETQVCPNNNVGIFRRARLLYTIQNRGWSDRDSSPASQPTTTPPLNIDWIS